MTARLCAFVIWALVAASAVFWGLRLGVRSPAAPAGVQSVEANAPARGDLVRLFGAAPVQPLEQAAAPPAESTRYRLTGVMAPRGAATPGAGRGGHYGIALIAVDGKPAKAYRVGARVEGEMVLQAVSLRSATVGASGSTSNFTLELPVLQAPSTGTLPTAPGFSPPLPIGLPLPQNMPPPQQQPQGEVGQSSIDAEGTSPLPPQPPLSRRNLGNATTR